MTKSELRKKGTKRTKSDITDLENNFFNSHVAYSIIALANLITQNTFKNTLTGTELSVNEWRILRLTYLYQSICAVDVISIFGLDKTTASRAITRLRDAKLIRSSVNKQDRRQTDFLLTAGGKRLHDKVIKQDNISDDSIEKVLSKQEIRSFHSTMKKLRVHVKKMLEEGC